IIFIEVSGAREAGDRSSILSRPREKIMIAESTCNQQLELIKPPRVVDLVAITTVEFSRGFQATENTSSVPRRVATIEIGVRPIETEVAVRVRTIRSAGLELPSQGDASNSSVADATPSAYGSTVG
ncbi:MAG: hypothetical protein ABIP75_13845, partial [Pyrinomonadaceae bacterium]